MPTQLHSHEYDLEPPVSTDENGNPFPYMCRACETETGDPYRWTHDSEDDYRIECKKHGLQAIIDENSYTGFAGGTCYWYKLACGCQSVDESADIRAAQ